MRTSRTCGDGAAIAAFSGKIFNPPNYDPFSDADGDGDLDIGDVINLFGSGQILQTCPRYFEYNGDGVRTAALLSSCMVKPVQLRQSAP